MISTIDKAIVAGVLSAIALINAFSSAHIEVGEKTIATIVALLTPVLVWLVPNAEKGQGGK